MERYFVIANEETREVRGIWAEEQPELSIPFYSHTFKKAIFDDYPNFTCLIEGATEEEEIIN